MTMYDVGVDPSSKKIAIAAVSDYGDWHWESYLLDKWPESLPQAHRVWRRFLKRFPLVAEADEIRLWIEMPAVGRGGAWTTIIQSVVSGAFQAGALNERIAHIELVPPSRWKKGAVGRGNADKPAVAQWLREKYPSVYLGCGGDQDIIDAAGLAVYGGTRFTGASLDE